MRLFANTDWFDVLDRYGLPVVLLFMLLLVVIPTIWLAGVMVAKWIKPYIERAMDAHIDMCNSLSVNNDKQTVTLDKLDKSLEQGHGVTHRKIEEVHNDVKFIKEAARETWRGPAIKSGE